MGNGSVDSVTPYDHGRAELFSAEGFRVSLLEAEDAATLGELLASCVGFDELTCGLPPRGPSLPTASTALYLGIFEADDLAGVLNVVPDDPEPGTWSLGVLLIEQGWRGREIGREVYAAFERWARTSGAKRLMLDVPATNEVARTFWSEVGFRETARREGDLIHMTRDIGQA